ncbi:hypothetical protein ACOMHN_052228 [Nucella lapillus]
MSSRASGGLTSLPLQGLVVRPELSCPLTKEYCPAAKAVAVSGSKTCWDLFGVTPLPAPEVRGIYKESSKSKGTA